MLEALIYATLAGAAIPLGGFLASRERLAPGWLRDELRHTVIAFGGGALIAAVTLVLVPQGSVGLSAGAAIACFCFGGAFFAWLDRQIATRAGPHGQLVAMLADFVPEAAALGALFATGSDSAPLLAGLVALQNLPEAFNAYRETQGRPAPGTRILLLFVAMAFLGPTSALVGHLVLADAPVALGAIMVFAAGGILYLVFQDIAPKVQLRNAWGPPLGAVAGFALGLAGQLWLG